MRVSSQPMDWTRLPVMKSIERAASPTIKFRIPKMGPAKSGLTIFRGEVRTDL